MKHINKPRRKTAANGHTIYGSIRREVHG